MLMGIFDSILQTFGLFFLVELCYTSMASIPATFSSSILQQTASKAYFGHSTEFFLGVSAVLSSLTLPQLLKPDQNAAGAAPRRHAVSSNQSWRNVCPSSTGPQ